ncbi:hypothetical protein ABT348_07275 [Streptomyces olivaceus]|jgi:hypothetical protein|uniref:hypothetical protein n=1 Tax=Streptomyces olivaceus TaxID=47716 RepID=UPI0018A82F78|nr:hypothetical protein [Streptomyces olivaceus]MBF8169377.1 hypothetical protein [Streptomyces olivaceus]MBZ6079701.1 hypothetical protein [Streptomyces olivaceus]
MTYLAVFEGKSGQAVDRDVLVGALRSDWPDAEVTVSSDATPGREVRDVAWTYGETEGRIEGRSHIDGTCLYLEGPLRLAARFAVWYRGLVPSVEELIFCDDTYSFTVSVATGASPESVERAVEASF